MTAFVTQERSFQERLLDSLQAAAKAGVLSLPLVLFCGLGREELLGFLQGSRGFLVPLCLWIYGVLTILLLKGSRNFPTRFVERRQKQNQKSLQLLERPWERMETGEESELFGVAREMAHGLLDLYSQVMEEAVGYVDIYLKKDGELVLAAQAGEGARREEKLSFCVPCVFGNELYGKILIGQPSVSRRQDWRFLSTLAAHLAMIMKGRQMAAERLRAGQLGLLGQMLGAFSEQIKGPLTNINLTCELSLEESYSMAPGHQKVLQEILGHAALIEKIMDHIRNFSCLQEVQWTCFSVADVISESLKILDYQIQRKAVQVIRNFPEEPCMVAGDTLLLNIVFCNLIRNALQAMSRGGTLSISLKQTDSMVAIRFQDTGSGISEQNLTKIFERFFTTKGHEGMGIGLAFSQQIIELHKGQMTVKSRVGEGSSFIITMPVAQTMAEEQKAA